MAEFNLLLTVMLICITIISFGWCEPHCSKFHYEEKLLEKMVRLEFKLEQFEKGYKEMETNIREERQKLQEDAVKLNEQMEESKTSIASKLGDLDDEAKLISEKMLKDVQDAATAMEASRQQNEDLVKIPDVLFRAKDLAELSLSINDVFVYKTVLQNEGDGYDAGSGVFTAPVDGDYLLTAQMCGYRNKYIYYAFIVDNVEQKAMKIASSKYTCSTGTLFSRLKKGARVWLKSKNSSDATQDSYRWNVFSGILLKV